MSVERVGVAPISIRRFDVVGQDARDGPGFVGHLALAAADRERHVAPSRVPVAHMAPPFEPAGEIEPDYVGTAGLTAEEQHRIGLFVAEAESEYKAARLSKQKQYIVHPHVGEIRRDDRSVVARRFSCAGFVIEAYREAEIDLLSTNLEHLPPVGMDALKNQYPMLRRVSQDDGLREWLGIPGDGPWPVVLAGYVLNAMNRPDDEIRAQPCRAIAGDEFFPPRTVRL